MLSCPNKLRWSLKILQRSLRNSDSKVILGKPSALNCNLKSPKMLSRPQISIKVFFAVTNLNSFKLYYRRNSIKINLNKSFTV